MYLPPPTDPLALSDYGPRGWPHQHADPLRNRCAVGRKLALLGRMTEDHQGLLDELDQAHVSADGTSVDDLTNTVRELEQRIDGLES